MASSHIGPAVCLPQANHSIDGGKSITPLTA